MLKKPGQESSNILSCSIIESDGIPPLVIPVRLNMNRNLRILPCPLFVGRTTS